MNNVQTLEQNIVQTMQTTVAPTVLGELAKISDQFRRAKRALNNWYNQIPSMNDMQEQIYANTAIVAIIAGLQHHTVFNTFEINETDVDFVGFYGLDMANEAQFIYALEQLPPLAYISDSEQAENISYVYHEIRKGIA